MSKPDFVFKCKKCGHLLFTNATKKGVLEIIDTVCPCCGEEPDSWNGLWVIIRDGNFEEEYGGADSE